MKRNIRKVTVLTVVLLLVLGSMLFFPPQQASAGIYYPPPGEGLEKQNKRNPEEVCLDPDIINKLQDSATRRALWRDGYLVHVKGDFNAITDVASLRKTWHALTVGAAIKQWKIPSYDQKISVWQTELTGNDEKATWWHVITQSAGFDYPYDDFPDYEPGEMWTYSDYNPVHLNHALAKAYGKTDFYDNYDDVLKEAYFNTIGMRGWFTSTQYDQGSQMVDGVRLNIDLEDMGRLGLLVLSRGKWNGIEVIPRWFVEELESKQTHGMQVNYDGPNDGIIYFLDKTKFPESPYGYMTWVNEHGDYYPEADTHWAFGRGYGGAYILWNSANGIVYAGVGVQTNPTSDGVPHIIEKHIDGPNPLAKSLKYTPVTPCRVVDTRKAGGAISAGGTRSYNVRGSVFSQGGNAADCQSPKGEPRAVDINVTSVPLGNGWISAYPYDSSAPTASLVNYRSDAQNVANSGTIKTCFNCTKDINIKSGGGSTHVIIDVLGYYY